MQWLIDFFTSIGDIITSIFDFLILTLQSILQLILLLPRYLTYVFDLFTLLPAFMLPFVLMSLTILIVWVVKEVF